MALGAISGLALSAPLWLPGLSSLRASIRADQVAGAGLLPHGAALLFAQGYYGLPISGSLYFGTTKLPTSIPDYFETAAYVGVLAIVLVVVAFLVSIRRPIVIGFSVAALGCLLLAYRIGTPGVVQKVMGHLGLGSLVTSRSLPLLGFSVAVLAAIGLEQVITRAADKAIRRALVVGVALCTVALGFLAIRSSGGGLTAIEVTLRRESLYWPVSLLIAFVIASVVLLDSRISLPGPLRKLKSRPGMTLAALTLLGQSAFLLFAGVGINSYASVEFPATTGTAELAHYVGSSLVAIDDCVPSATFPICDVRGWNGTGLYPEMNLGYGIDELAVHDPLSPASLFDSWPIANAGQRSAGVNLFAPSVNTAALARRYGASFILLCHSTPTFCQGVAPPPGTKPVATIDGDELVSVPDSSRFVSSSARITAVDHPSDVTYQVHLASFDTASTIVAHITASPGWKASVDGKSATLRVTDGVGLSVLLPAHASEVTFTYSPPHFVPALALALVAVLAMAAEALWRRRRGGTSEVEEESRPLAVET
jgi:hypothetical protein